MTARCRFAWCDHTTTLPEHWTMTYTPATHSPGTLKVGVGVSWDEGETVHPGVAAVHIFGADGLIDADAQLRLSEARALRDALDCAITTAESVEHAGTGAFLVRS